MNQNSTPKSMTSVKERWVSICLLGLLIFIGGAVLVLQSRYDVGDWRESSQASELSKKNKFDQDAVEGLKPLSAGEQYDATNLSDKINGKAEFYLTAGFKQLESQRFGLASDPGRWLERYVYHMEEHRSAFAVFSSQRRSDVSPLELGEYAYRVANGLFMVHGPFYMEIIAAEVSDEMRARALDLARTFIAGHTVVSPPLDELALFPNQGRVPNTRILVAADAFGLDGLNWVFTGHYAEKGHEATAFISLRASAAEADDLARAFITYWRDYGGEAVVLPKARMKYRTMTILDNYELVWVHGRYLMGLHEATDLDFGLDLADRLYQAVKKGTP